MIDKAKIKKIIEEREALFSDDPRINEYWNVLTEELTNSEEETIEFLCQCDEHDIYWLSEVFDDISEVLQSQKFIDTIKNLQAKYPNVNMEPDIFFAELAMQQNNSDKGKDERNE